jgi:RNA ligase (TIGR02306 family)
MATFVVEVLSLTAVEPHPNADRLELAVVGNYRVIVRKGEFHAGDLVAYIPEASVLPDDLVERLDIRAYLAGPRHDRVRAARLRGVLSQGLVYPAHAGWVAGQDVAAELGITKWEPEIPLHMRGTAGAAPTWWKGYDVEPYNRYPHLLTAGEPVYVTEKIHGTCGIFGRDGADESRWFVSTKSHSDGHRVLLRVHEEIGQVWEAEREVQVFGEIYGTQTPGGRRIQDLTYNAALGLRLAIFDIAMDGMFLPYDEAMDATRRMGLAFAPLLYAGPFEPESVLALAFVPETVSGTKAHIREGIVIRPQTPRESEEIGRVLLKFVGASYLTRGGEVTEFN